MKAIPTEYAGVRFRSRLEAKWAAFFDLCGWRWDYEPIDLEGYIPDFVLRFENPLLVEIKPILDWTNYKASDIVTNAIFKIAEAGWTGRAVLLGAVVGALQCTVGELSVLGLTGCAGLADFEWDPAIFGTCPWCNRSSFIAYTRPTWDATDRSTWTFCESCRTAPTPSKQFMASSARDLFARASNAVQWRKA